ncbi:neutral zinc metallopeptidase [Deinococcus lacus]|uniref:Neutral zinc metallopeptidase n=1 Tax=Deinococcus lacus TaxID=392561 RepID=A0ABW1YBF7_9DEIO
MLLALLGLFFGVDTSVLTGGDQAPVSQSAPAQPGQDEVYDFADRIMTSSNQVWGGIFQQSGQTYNQPRMFLFSGATNSGCGRATSAVGPFYCPADSTVYLDTSFFDQMDRQLGGGGDFAYSYVIAHEVGHHVQNELGLSEQVQRKQQQVSEAESNSLSVRVELQADCFAGVWGNHVSSLANITEEDVREAVNTAAAIGDDHLQEQARGYVQPDSFTHGSSDQRVRWFMRGFTTGNPNQCDTFKGSYSQL